LTEFIWFVGRFHVLVVHLPLGILSLAVALEILVRFRPFKSLESALAPVWIAGAVSALAAVALGFMHATEESFQDMDAVDDHRWAGVLLAVAACVAAILRTRMNPVTAWPRWAGPERIGVRLYNAVQPFFARGAALDRAYGRLWGVPVAVVAVLMFVTGHLGGNLTHGDTYLVQYAPNAIRMLAGLPPNAEPRPKPADLASADIYLDVVQPALARRCSNCHNSSKTSGGLSMVSYEALMKGGNKGAVIKPGNPTGSDLQRRIELSPDNSDYMPKEGKTPLNRYEVTAISWWISQGAPATAAVGSLKPAADAASAIRAAVGLSGGGDDEVAAGTEEEPLPEVAAADKAALAKVMGEGFTVRQVARGSNFVDVDYVRPTPVTADAMSNLAKIGANILRLNLRHAGVTDAEVKTIAGFANLRRLRMEENAITDAAAADIAALKNLTYLNLTNTKVTDTGFDQVAALPKLSRIYVWGTDISSEAVEKVKASRKDVILYAGLTAKDVPVEMKVMSPTN
jgi:uncharacterized membrane protein